MRCANPQCQAESDYLRSGRLQWIDEVLAYASVRQGRYIWLCSTCAPEFVVETWRPPGQQLRPSAAADKHTPQHQPNSASVRRNRTRQPGTGEAG